MKKIIKLINNERMNKKVTSVKASDSIYCDDPTAIDVCRFEDNAHCTVYSFDTCEKDYAACTKYATDYCAPEYDLSACMGSGTTDY